MAADPALPAGSGIDHAEGSSALRVENLSKSFGANLALAALDLTAPEPLDLVGVAPEVRFVRELPNRHCLELYRTEPQHLTKGSIAAQEPAFAIRVGDANGRLIEGIVRARLRARGERARSNQLLSERILFRHLSGKRNQRRALPGSELARSQIKHGERAESATVGGEQRYPGIESCCG